MATPPSMNVIIWAGSFRYLLFWLRFLFVPLEKEERQGGGTPEDVDTGCMSDASKDNAALHHEESLDGEDVKEARAGEGGGGNSEEAVSVHGEEEQEDEERRLDDGVGQETKPGTRNPEKAVGGRRIGCESACGGG